MLVVCGWRQGLPHLSPSNSATHLRRIQVYALLSASFFGIIPHGQRDLLSDWGNLRLNALDMHHRGFFERAPKFQALLAYFGAMHKRMGSCWMQMLERNDFSEAKCPATCLCQEGRTLDIAPVDEKISFYLHTPEPTTFTGPKGEQVSRDKVDVDEMITQPIPLTKLVVKLDGDITKSDGNLQVRLSRMHCDIAYGVVYNGRLSAKCVQLITASWSHVSV